MRGSFPLNGTYFQVNEVFADHETSRNPINVPRDSIWNLPKRTVYFGTSVPSIFNGLTTEEIQLCFLRGFVCARGFDRNTRAPRQDYTSQQAKHRETRNKRKVVTQQKRQLLPLLTRMDPFEPSNLTNSSINHPFGDPDTELLFDNSITSSQPF